LTEVQQTRQRARPTQEELQQHPGEPIQQEPQLRHVLIIQPEVRQRHDRAQVAVLRVVPNRRAVQTAHIVRRAQVRQVLHHPVHIQAEAVVVAHAVREAAQAEEGDNPFVSKA